MSKSALRAALLAVGLSAFSGVAHAGCSIGEAPAIPDGATAAEADMAQAQKAIKSYMVETQEFLACIEAGARGRMTAEDSRQYSEANARMEKLAKNFNVQLRAYKARG